MELWERLAEYQQAFDAIVAFANCRHSLLFADLCWPPFDPEAELRRLTKGRDPGVMFETASRVVVIEEHSAELRYYAGGWCSNQSRIRFEQDRITAEGYEMGVFPCVQGAVLFAEKFLAREMALQDIETPRSVHHRRETDGNRRTSHSS